MRTALRIDDRALRNSRLLAIQTVQVTSEASAKPIMTAFTMGAALRNIPQGERSRGNVATPTGGASASGAGELVAVGCAGAAGEAAGAGGLSPSAKAWWGTAEIAKTTAATITSFLLDRCIFPLRLSRSGPAIGQVPQPRQAIHFRTSMGYVQFGIIVILVCLFLEITLAMT